MRPPMQRKARHGLGLYLLAFQVMNVGLDKIPPVTLATIAAQVAIFLEVGDLERWFPSASAVCISPFLVWQRKQWMRLIFATFYHAHDLHLYYNMISFMWKGIMLEKKFKSIYFGYLLAVFCAMTSLMYIGVNMVLSLILDDPSYETSCAVGFSAVIFALKVLTTHYTPPGTQYVLGFIPVPSRMVFWAELVIIQLLVPNASFTGHLAGILVGLLYVKGPLKNIMDIVLPSGLFSQSTFFIYRFGFESYADSSGGSGTTPSAPMPDYDEYTGGLSDEEQLRYAQQESLHQNIGSNQNSNRMYPDLDDLRQRRQQRFQ
ncbi:hypothetical protein ScPMuIL_018848 [Solemya velum]